MKLVSVEWIDSNGTSTWTPYDDMLSDVKQRDLTCRTVGWQMLDAPDRIAIVSSQTASGSVADATVIPRVAVLSITEITPP